METIPPIPEQWAVWRYDKNYEEVNKYFNWLYPDKHLLHGNYVHFPRINNYVCSSDHLPEGYTEITPGQFRKYILPIMEERMDKLEVGDVITKAPNDIQYYINRKGEGFVFGGSLLSKRSTLNREISKIEGEYFQLKEDAITWLKVADFVKPGYIPDTQTKQTPIMNREQPVSRYRTKVDLPDIKAGTEGIYDPTADRYKFPSLELANTYRWYKAESVKNTQFFEPLYDFKEGDWVEILTAGEELSTNRKGDVGIIVETDIKSNRSMYKVEVSGRSKEGNWSLDKNIRLATPEQIEKSKIKIIEIGPSVIVTIKGNEVKAEGSFGVVETTAEDLDSIVRSLTPPLKIGKYRIHVKTIHIGCKEEGIEVSMEKLNRILLLSGQ